jgi:hypothetical protein
MDNKFKETEADRFYDRFDKTVGISQEAEVTDFEVQESARGDQVHLDGIIGEEADPVLLNDERLNADIGLNSPAAALDEQPGTEWTIIGDSAPERDEVLTSDAILAANASGLTGGTADYATENHALDIADEYEPLEDVPDADDIDPDSPVDPASPPDIVHGTDLLNGSQGD